MWHIETDLFALMIFCIMFYKKYRERGRTPQSRAFSVLLVGSIITVTVDFAASAAMNWSQNWWVYELLMVLYCLTMPALAVLWLLYTLILVSNGDRRWAAKRFIPALLPYAVIVPVAISNPVTGLFFHLDAQLTYTRGPLFMVLGVGSIAFYTVLGLATVIYYRRRITPAYHVTLLALFFVSTATSIWVQLLHPGWLIMNATYAVVYVLCDMTIEEDRRTALQKKIKTQQRELEQALEDAKRANDSKTDFLSRMSHDIRTPINTIMGSSALALDRDNPPETTKALEEISNASRFLLDLVNDVLDTDRIASGRMVLHKGPYTKDAFFSCIKAMIGPQCEKKGIHFRFAAHAFGATVLVDRMRVQQIFFNLLSNAVKFTPPGGTITFGLVSAYVDPRHLLVECTVTDTGCGMSKEFMAHMYDAFVQEERTHVSESEGSGLGLAIAKQLVELMDGEIECVSAPGQGTTFTVRIPLEITTPQAQDGAGTALADLAGKKVLLVEDHPVNRAIAAQLLEKKGILVQEAENGQAALDNFIASPPGYFDLILMDIRMPVLNGLDATRAIRALPRPDAAKVPILALTANAYNEEREEILQAGMNDHLAKPIEPDALYTALESWIGKNLQAGI